VDVVFVDPFQELVEHFIRRGDDLQHDSPALDSKLDG
jgi:hypothetical protein